MSNERKGKIRFILSDGWIINWLATCDSKLVYPSFYLQDSQDYSLLFNEKKEKRPDEEKVSLEEEERSWKSIRAVTRI